MASSSTSATSLSAKIQLESDPAGADIEVDGSFVGNTPSEVQVSDGEHTVSVKKTGFKDWERKLKVSGGSSVHLPRNRRRQRDLVRDGCIARRTSLRSARQAQKKREHDSCAPSDFPVICFCFLLAQPPSIASLVEAKSKAIFLPWKRIPVSEFGPLSFFMVTAALSGAGSCSSTTCACVFTATFLPCMQCSISR